MRATAWPAAASATAAAARSCSWPRPPGPEAPPGAPPRRVRDRGGGPLLFLAQAAGTPDGAGTEQVGDLVQVLIEADDDAGPAQFGRGAGGEQVAGSRADADDGQAAPGAAAGD